ncbi:MAG: hypothetical protein H0U10_17770 [Chloroflexia bacterium]|nr:hypothetical protein [Chloroflexia bacterium]
MNPVVAVIWWVMLVVTVVVVVPIVVGLLIRAVVAARNIERYTAEALRGGVGIAENTAHVTALKETIAVATGLLAGAESIQRSTAAIGEALAAGQAGEGRAEREEVEAWRPS